MPTAITHDPVFTTPVSSTNTAVVRWSGTAGSVLQNSGVLIDGSNNITGIAGLTATQVDITGQGDLRLQDTTGGQYVALQANGTTTTHTLTFPAAQGAADTFLTNNGSGALTWTAPDKTIQMVVIDFATALTTGNGKFYFHVPSTLNGFNIVDVHAEVITAPAGSTIIIQLHNLTATADILTTLLTIDANETGSDTAAAAAVISGSEDDLTTNDVLRVDIDQVGSSTAGSGLIVTMICRLP